MNNIPLYRIDCYNPVLKVTDKIDICYGEAVISIWNEPIGKIWRVNKNGEVQWSRHIMVSKETIMTLNVIDLVNPDVKYYTVIHDQHDFKMFTHNVNVEFNLRWI